MLLRQVVVNGTLALPSGVTAAGVTVRLTSPAQNLTLTGTQFEGQFYATPGTYTLYAAAISGNRSYAHLQLLTIGSSGGTLSPIPMLGAGTRVIANVTQPDGTLLGANFPVTITGPGGTTVPASAIAGQVIVILPSNSSYGFALNTTQLVNTSSGPSTTRSR